MATHFRDAKRVVLHKLGAGTDYSPKGSIDAPVAALCAFINALPPFVTLSSCSGRIAVYAHGPGLATARGSADGGAAGGDDGDGDTDGSTKGSGRWLFVTHGPHGVTAADIAAALAECDAWPGSSAVLKVEPLILHVQAADVPAARLLLTAALDAGYRESGITLGGMAGRDGVGTKIVVAVRSTAASLEVPLREAGATLVDGPYIAHLASVATSRFSDVARRRQRFDALWRQRAAHLVPAPPPAASPAAPLAGVVVTCTRCGGGFASRSALFKHLKTCASAGTSTAAAAAPSPPPTPAVAASEAPSAPTAATAAATALSCRGCGAVHATRNALFRHVHGCALARAAAAGADGGDVARSSSAQTTLVVTLADVAAAAAAQARSLAYLAAHVQPLVGSSASPRVDSAALSRHALATGSTTSVTRLLGSVAAATTATDSTSSPAGTPALRWRLMEGDVTSTAAASSAAAAPSMDAEGHAHTPLHRWGAAAAVVGDWVVWHGGFVATGTHGLGSDLLVRRHGHEHEHGGWLHASPPAASAEGGAPAWPRARQKHTLTATNGGACIMLGGHGGMTKPCMDAWMLQVGADVGGVGSAGRVELAPPVIRWQQLEQTGDVPPPRWGHTVCPVSLPHAGGAADSATAPVRSSLLLLCGRDANRSYDDVHVAHVDESGLRLQWRRVTCDGDLRPRARYGHAAVTVHPHHVVLHGGFVGPHAHCGSDGTVSDAADRPVPPLAGTPLLDDVWVLDCSRWRWSRVRVVDEVERPFALPPRMAHAMAALPAGGVLVWGGACKNPQLNAAVLLHLHAQDDPAMGHERVATASLLPDNAAYAHVYDGVDGAPPAESAASSSSGRIPAAHLPWPLRAAAVVIPRAGGGADLWSLGGGGVAFAWGAHYNASVRCHAPSSVAAETATHGHHASLCCLVPLPHAQAAKAALHACGALDTTRVAKPRRLRDCGLVGTAGVATWQSFHNHLTPWLALPVVTPLPPLPPSVADAPLVRCDLPAAADAKAREGDAASQLQAAAADVRAWLAGQRLDPDRSASAQEALRSFPTKFEWVGDVAVVPRGSLAAAAWTSAPDGMWLAAGTALQRRLGAVRIARHAEIDEGGTRASRMTPLFGARPPASGAYRLPGEAPAAPLPPVDTWPTAEEAAAGTTPEEAHSAAICLRQLDIGSGGWVAIRDHGVVYHLDLLRVMYSSGNGTEKARMGALPHATHETVVDLFAGIGYFTLPLLVRAGVRMVHACEWNPDALACLRMNLAANKVPPTRYRVWAGDNRAIAATPGCPLVGVAHRVLLGLIPTSVPFLPVALRCLRSEGGVLHVHANHREDELPAVRASLVAEVTLLWRRELAARTGRTADSSATEQAWTVSVPHTERVKSYAPHVHHYVFDVVVSGHGAWGGGSHC